MTPPPAVLVVLPDYPLPATTGLHLRMVAVLQLLRRIGCAVHRLFGTGFLIYQHDLALHRGLNFLR